MPDLGVTAAVLRRPAVLVRLRGSAFGSRHGAVLVLSRGFAGRG